MNPQSESAVCDVVSYLEAALDMLEHHGERRYIAENIESALASFSLVVSALNRTKRTSPKPASLPSS